jgi:hydrogenase maturation protease
MMKTLVLGLGNPFLSDDSVGLRVAQIVEDRLNSQDTTVVQSSLAGLSLLELMVGFDRVIIVDAVQIKKGKPGQIYRLGPEEADTTSRAPHSHGLNFTAAFELGKKLGLALPQQTVILGIEVEDITTLSEQCTPDVENAIPVVADMVIDELSSS